MISFMKTIDKEIPGFENFVDALAEHITVTDEELQILERGNKYFDHLDKLRQNNHNIELCDYCRLKRGD